MTDQPEHPADPIDPAEPVDPDPELTITTKTWGPKTSPTEERK